MRAVAGFFAFLFLIVLFIGAGFIYAQMQLVAPGPLEAPKTVVIARGTGVGAMAKQLQNEGVVTNQYLFRLGYFLNEKPGMKAGEYTFAAHETLRDTILKIARGDVVVRKFTAPEGLTSAEIIKLLQAETALTGDIKTEPPEGTLMPDTYRFSLGDTRESLIKQMQKAMTDAVNAAWASHDADLPVTSPADMLTLASIVEKETGVASERPRVAGVFVNRLKAKMPLQSDPTVTYGITLGKAPLGRLLTTADLQKATPYNTYTIAALPPGPICNPGRAALRAAAQPEKNNYLYFVADGTSGHVFAATLDEHNKNVANWRELNKVLQAK